jgi:DNA repair photolyase
MTKKPISGTAEWASKNVNIILGCKHRCRYCYARTNALRFKQIQSPEEWGDTYNRVREDEVKRVRPKYGGTVMFPTTHDIVPEFLDECKAVIRKLLEAGNQVLIVSKPHEECIKSICDDFGEYKDQILFRFTIGAADGTILSYWEPGAPTFVERLRCLQYAHKLGFQTSVSCEPMLDSPNVEELFYTLKPYVTNSIWIGKLNKARKRILIETDEDERQVCRIEKGQTDERIREIYEALKDEPLVKWKESFKTVLGLSLAEKPGLDI